MAGVSFGSRALVLAGGHNGESSHHCQTRKYKHRLQYSDFDTACRTQASSSLLRVLDILHHAITPPMLGLARSGLTTGPARYKVPAGRHNHNTKESRNHVFQQNGFAMCLSSACIAYLNKHTMIRLLSCPSLWLNASDDPGETGTRENTFRTLQLYMHSSADHFILIIS